MLLICSSRSSRSNCKRLWSEIKRMAAIAAAVLNGPPPLPETADEMACEETDERMTELPLDSPAPQKRVAAMAGVFIKPRALADQMGVVTEEIAEIAHLLVEFAAPGVERFGREEQRMAARG